MREDFFYRLCGDQVQTVSLREILDDSPVEINLLISFICKKLFGEKGGAELEARIFRILENAIPDNYDWPGNFRELEQVVRNVVVTGQYYPPMLLKNRHRISDYYRKTNITMDQWISLYAQKAYENTGSYREAGTRIGVDQRTLKKWTLLFTKQVFK
jgi:transcriptional regulator with PAS, ATPase and Fis domain